MREIKNVFANVLFWTGLAVLTAAFYLSGREYMGQLAVLFDGQEGEGQAGWIEVLYHGKERDDVCPDLRPAGSRRLCRNGTAQPVCPVFLLPDREEELLQEKDMGVRPAGGTDGILLGTSGIAAGFCQVLQAFAAAGRE